MMMIVDMGGADKAFGECATDLEKLGERDRRQH